MGRSSAVPYCCYCSARGFAGTFYDHEIALGQLRFARFGQGSVQRVGKECDGAVGADEVGDASIDLREGDSEGVYEEQGERVGGLIPICAFHVQ